MKSRIAILPVLIITCLLLTACPNGNNPSGSDPLTVPSIISFDGTPTSQTAVEFSVGISYTGTISSLNLEIDYDDGNTEEINNDAFEEVGPDEYAGRIVYDYETTGDYMPEVTVTNTETGESDSESFESNEVTLTVQKEGDGEGTVVGILKFFVSTEIINCGTDCDEPLQTLGQASIGMQVALSAEPEPISGSVFTGWSDDIEDGNSETTCEGTGDCEVEVDQDRTITATFEKEASEGDVLPTGLFGSPEGLSDLEGAYRLYQRFLSNFKTAFSHNSIQQLEERQFGLLSGKMPMAFSGETGFVVMDLLTNETLLSGMSASFPRGSPAFGVIGLTETPPGPDSPATIVLFGETGFGFYNTEFGGTQASMQPTAFDAFPAGGNPESGYAVGIQEGVVFIGLDEANGDHDIREAGSFESAFDGEPVSAWMPDAFDPTVTPALVLTRDDDPGNSVESGVYVEIRNDDPPVRAVDVGLDARKIRCAPDGLGAYLCAVSVFGDDELALLAWDGTSSEPNLMGTIGVGDGPVDLDVRFLPNDNIGVVSTGYNDDTVTITELGSGGSVLSNNTQSVPDGCEGPAHAILLHDEASLKVMGTCTDSANYFIIESGL